MSADDPFAMEGITDDALYNMLDDSVENAPPPPPLGAPAVDMFKLFHKPGPIQQRAADGAGPHAPRLDPRLAAQQPLPAVGRAPQLHPPPQRPLPAMSAVPAPEVVSAQVLARKNAEIENLRARMRQVESACATMNVRYTEAQREHNRVMAELHATTASDTAKLRSDMEFLKKETADSQRELAKVRQALQASVRELEGLKLQNRRDSLQQQPPPPPPCAPTPRRPSAAAAPAAPADAPGGSCCGSGSTPPRGAGAEEPITLAAGEAMDAPLPPRPPALPSAQQPCPSPCACARSAALASAALFAPSASRKRRLSGAGMASVPAGAGCAALTPCRIRPGLMASPSLAAHAHAAAAGAGCAPGAAAACAQPPRPRQAHNDARGDEGDSIEHAGGWDDVEPVDLGAEPEPHARARAQQEILARARPQLRASPARGVGGARALGGAAQACAPALGGGVSPSAALQQGRTPCAPVRGANSLEQPQPSPPTGPPALECVELAEGQLDQCARRAAAAACAAVQTDARELGGDGAADALLHEGLSAHAAASAAADEAAAAASRAAARAADEGACEAARSLRGSGQRALRWCLLEARGAEGSMHSLLAAVRAVEITRATAAGEAARRSAGAACASTGVGAGAPALASDYARLLTLVDGRARARARGGGLGERGAQSPREAALERALQAALARAHATPSAVSPGADGGGAASAPCWPAGLDELVGALEPLLLEPTADRQRALGLGPRTAPGAAAPPPGRAVAGERARARPPPADARGGAVDAAAGWALLASGDEAEAAVLAAERRAVCAALHTLCAAMDAVVAVVAAAPRAPRAAPAADGAPRARAAATAAAGAVLSGAAVHVGALPASACCCAAARLALRLASAIAPSTYAGARAAERRATARAAATPAVGAGAAAEACARELRATSTEAERAAAWLGARADAPLLLRALAGCVDACARGACDGCWRLCCAELGGWLRGANGAVESAGSPVGGARERRRGPAPAPAQRERGVALAAALLCCCASCDADGEAGAAAATACAHEALLLCERLLLVPPLAAALLAPLDDLHGSAALPYDVDDEGCADDDDAADADGGDGDGGARPRRQQPSAIGAVCAVLLRTSDAAALPADAPVDARARLAQLQAATLRVLSRALDACADGRRAALGACALPALCGAVAAAEHNGALVAGGLLLHSAQHAARLLTQLSRKAALALDDDLRAAVRALRAAARDELPGARAQRHSLLVELSADCDVLLSRVGAGR